MKKRAAIELSMNFLVIIILSIVIFGFGIVFMRNLFSEARELEESILKDLDSEIDSLICEGSERVCISSGKTIKRKDHAIFGVSILNILDTQDFTITIVHPADYLGFKKDKTPIDTSSPKLIVIPSSRTVTIAKNEEKEFRIGVGVPANAVSGTYILDVNIILENNEPYSAVHKLYVEVP